MRLIYKCPKCGSNYLFEQWVNVTREYFDKTEADYTIYYCPWCGMPSSFEELSYEWETESFSK